MGRPIKKAFFGANAKNNIRVQFFNGEESVAGAIVKQTGTKKFMCVDDAGKKSICKLVSKEDNDLVAGEMSITVENDAGDLLFVRKISQHKITASNGKVYPWNFLNLDTDGKVQVEEAGTDNSFTDNTDLT